jgi:1,4-dihydroxy-2-naphthoyl-CoA hydrolase
MENIWFKKDLQLADFAGIRNNTMGGFLGMQFSEVGANFLKATMPVDDRTKQPYGLLHGGASAALAETIGSVASTYVVDHEKMMCVGIEINANHIRGAKSGIVTATCTPLHLGAQTHVWDIKIHDENEKLICVSRLTVAVLKRKGTKE